MADSQTRIVNNAGFTENSPFSPTISALYNPNGLLTGYSYDFNQAYAFNSMASGKTSREQSSIAGMDEPFKIGLDEEVSFKVDLVVNKENFLISSGSFGTGEGTGAFPAVTFDYLFDEDIEDTGYISGYYPVCKVKNGTILEFTLRDNIQVDKRGLQQLGTTGKADENLGGIGHLIVESGRDNDTLPTRFRAISGGSGIQVSYDVDNISGGSYIIIDTTGAGGGGGSTTLFSNTGNTSFSQKVYFEGTGPEFSSKAAFREIESSDESIGLGLSNGNNTIDLTFASGTYKNYFNWTGANTGEVSSESVKVYVEGTGPVGSNKAAFREIYSESGTVGIGLTNSDNTISIEFHSGKYKPYYNWTGENVGVGSQIYKAGTGPAFNSKAQFRKIVGEVVDDSNYTEGEQKATVTVGVSSNDDIEIGVDLSTAAGIGVSAPYPDGDSRPSGTVLVGGIRNATKGYYNSIAGGGDNTISGGPLNFVGGGSGNDVNFSRLSSSLGGENNDISGSNRSTVLGGKDNLIHSGGFNFLGGGQNNKITGTSYSSIVGGEGNLVTGLNSVLAGGNVNSIFSDYSFIGGGESNIASGEFSIIAGGEQNKTFATHSIVLGGQDNVASGAYSFIGGGKESKVLADYGFAAGRNSTVSVGNSGAFVLSDAFPTETLSSGANTLTLNFKSGVYVDSDSGIYINGNPVLTGVSGSEGDTLQIVTDRGATTTNDITVADLLVQNNGQVRANGNGSITLGNTNGGTIRVSGDGSRSVISPRFNDLRIESNRDEDDILFYAGEAGVEMARFDSENQRFGILTTSPDQALDVAGVIASQQGSAGRVTGLNLVNTTNAANTEVGITMGVVDTHNTACDVSLVAKRMAANAGSDFFIELSDSAGTATERFRIDEDGNVGIGTTDPSARLHVNGPSAGFAEALRLQRAGGNYYSVGLDNSRVNFVYNSQTTANSTLTIDGGNTRVGIGTHAPSRHLHVEGGGTNVLASFESTDAGAYLSFSDDSTTNDTSVRLGAVGNNLQIFTNGSEQVRITSAGKVGIGTNTPSGHLHIQGAAVAGYVSDTYADLITESADSRIQVVSDNGGSNGSALILTNVNAGTHSNWAFGQATTAQGNKLHIGHNTSAGGDVSAYTISQDLVIDTGGNVGLGTFSPQKAAHLYVDGNDGLRIQSSNNHAFTQIMAHTDYSAYIQFRDGANRYWIQSTTDDKLRFRPNATSLESATINFDATGNVGIGVLSPTEKLEVGTDTDVSAVIGKAHVGYMGQADSAFFGHVDFATTSNYAIKQNSAGNTMINVKAGGSIGFNIANATKAAINNGGDFYVDTDTLYVDASEDRVGINDSSPSHALDVNGIIRTQGDNKGGGLLGTQFSNIPCTTIDGFFASTSTEDYGFQNALLMNDLAGFTKWAGVTIKTSGLYKTRGGSAGSYTYSNEAGTGDFDRAFQANNNTVGSWYTDSGPDGDITTGAANSGSIELYFNGVKSLNYSAQAAVLFGSAAFRATHVKIEAHRTGAWQTILDETGNSKTALIARIASNGGGANATTGLRYTFAKAGSYFRINNFYAADYDLGNDLSYGGQYYIDKYYDGRHYSTLYPVSNGESDLGTSSQRYGDLYSLRGRISNKFGIGNDALNFPLNVGGAEDTLAQFTSSDNKAGILIQDDDTAAYVSVENNILALGPQNGTNAAQNLNYNVTNYRLGIGTNVPDLPLHVKGTGIRIEESGAARHLDILPASAGINHKFTSDSTSAGYEFHNNAGNICSFGQTSSIFNQTVSVVSSNINLNSAHYVQFGNANYRIQGSAGSNYLRLYGGGNVAVNIDGSANVGIGTTAPSTMLHVEGTGTFHSVDITGASTLTVSGNVGIGTTNPAFELDVVGTIHGTSGNFTNGITIDGNPVVTGSSAEDSDTLQIVTDRGATTTNAITLQNNLTLSYNYPRINLTDTDNNSDYSILNNDGSFGIYDVTNSAYRLQILSGGNVGINTTSPKGKLHIEGDKSYSLGYLDATSDLHIGNDTMSSAVGAYAGSISFGSTDESNLQAASIVAIQTDTDPNEIGLAFFTQHSQFGSTNLAESMRISNDGNVGIGTTNPTAQLHVHGSAGALRIHSSAGGANVYLESQAGNLSRVRWNGLSSFAIRDDNDNADRLTITTDGDIVANDNKKFKATTYSSSYLSFSDDTTLSANSDIIFDVNGSEELMRLEEGGKVGIGITAPQSKLDVRLGGATSAEMNSTGVNNLLTLRAGNNEDPASVANAGARWGMRLRGYITDTSNPNRKTAAVYAVSEDSLGYNRKVGMALHTSPLDADHVERVRIDCDGQVGIGTTDPQAQLHVAGGNILVDSQYGIRFNDANTRIYTNAETPEDLIVEADQDLHLDPDGVVKVDTAEFQITSSAAYTTHLNHNNAGNNFISQANGGTTQFRNSAGTLMQLNSNGNLSIGAASSTTTRLFVTGAVSDSLARFKDGDDGVEIATRGASRQQIDFLGSNTSSINAKGSLFINYDSDNGGSNDNISFTRNGVDEAGTVDMVITEGKVGIGTTNPSAKLHIDGGLIVSGTSTTGINIVGESNYYTTIIGNDESHPTQSLAGGRIIGPAARRLYFELLGNDATDHFRFLTSPNNDQAADNVALHIGNDGDVGIGTASPISRLNIKSSATSSEDSALSITQNGGANTIFAVGERATNGAQMLLYDGGTATHAFYTDGTDNYINAGNVGIGVTSPSQKLEIIADATALADQPAEPLFVHNNGNNIDGRVFLSVKHDRISTASALGAGLKMTAGAVTAGTASYFDSLIYLEGAAAGSDTIHSAPKAIKFYVDNHGTAAGDGTDYTQLGDLRLTIAEDGNIGIGDATPIGDLQIGTNVFSGANGVHADDRIGLSVNGSLKSMVYASTYNNATYPDYGMVFIHGPNTGDYNVWSISPDGPAKGSGLNFIYRKDATNIHTTAPLVYFNGDGAVGIGTISPDAHLNVYNTGTTSSVADAHIVGSGNTYGLLVERLTNDSLIVSKSTTAGSYFKTDSATSSFQGYKIGDNWFMGQYGYNDFRIVDGTQSAGDAAAALTVQNTTKYVGIGTTEPADTLQVAGQVRIDGSTTDGLTITSSAGASQGLLLFNNSSTDTASIINYYNGPLLLGQNNAEVITIDNDSVGINVAAPAGDKLMVKAENNYFAARLDGATTAGQSNGLRVRAGYNSTDRPVLIEKADGSDVFIIDGLGNVGIGSSPSYELDVNGTTRSTYYIGGAYLEENASSSKLKLYPDGTVLVIDEDGELKPCDKENDTLVFGVSKIDFDSPVVLGAEPILVTGPIKVGDYIVTSSKQGHGQAMKEQKLGTIIAQAMENGDGESYNIKAMIRKM